MATLRRLSDGAGDSGARVVSIRWKKDRTFDRIEGSRPIVGNSMLVGSVSARTYSRQDYWLTTPVTEILEERKNYVKFRTENSIYELKY